MVEAKRAETVPPHVGRLMRKWRKVAGRTLEQVANEIGCSKGHLSSAENGKGNLSLPLFLAYCEAIKTPVSRVCEDRILPKHRDVDRLAGELVTSHGTGDLEWLAALSREDFQAAMEGARDAVDLHHLRASRRRKSRRHDAS